MLPVLERMAVSLLLLNRFLSIRSNPNMTTRQVIVPWEKGLHLRVATKLVRLAQSFHSTIRIHCGGQVANVRSIISMISLCAVMGSTLEIEVTGEDEQEAAQAVEQVFAGEDRDSSSI